MEQSSKQAVIESMLLQLPGNHLKLDREREGLRGIHINVSLVLQVGWIIWCHNFQAGSVSF